MPKIKFSEKGFTLVELMVVIAITALIAGFTVAEINSTSYKLKSAARTLRAKVQQARLLAVKEDCNVYVDFDLDGDGTIDQFYTLWRDLDDASPDPTDPKPDGNYNASVTPSELIETVALPDDLSFGAVSNANGGPGASPSPTSTVAPPADGISYSGDQLCFDSRGTSSNAWAYLQAPNKDSTGTYAVGTNNVGRIQTRYWATNGGAWR